MNYKIPNGTITTGWHKTVNNDSTYSVSNEAGVFYACPKASMGVGVYQVFVDIAAFVGRNCTTFSAVAVASDGVDLGHGVGGEDDD